jgi:hypothetical protein
VGHTISAKIEPVRAAIALCVLLGGTAPIVACKCPSTVLGVHNGDEIETTIEATYDGGVESIWGVSGVAAVKCTGLNDMGPGTMLTFQASFETPGGGCPSDNLSVTLKSSSNASLSPSPGGPNFLSFHGDGGCSGTEWVQIVLAGTNMSLYDNSGVDGASVSWYLGRTFDATPDSGCVVPSPCSDLFIAHNQQP